MLAEEISKYIDETGIKQKKVAEDAGLTQQQLSDICNGRRKVEAVEYFNICRALGVSLDYFPEKLGITGGG